jgi:hypothetical protein
VASYSLPGRAAAGDGGYITATSVLADSVSDNAVQLPVQSIKGFAAGDIVRLNGKGIQKFAQIEAVGTTFGLTLASPLQGSFQKGAVVTRYNPGLRISATSKGAWGNRIKIVITPLASGTESTDFSMRITVDRGKDLSRPSEEELYRKLSLDPSSELFAPRIVNKRSQLIQMNLPGDPAAPLTLLIQDDAWRLQPTFLQGGRDGLDKVTTFDMAGGTDDLRGLRLLEEIDEVSILGMPDAIAVSDVMTPYRPPRRPIDPCKPGSFPAPVPEQDRDDKTSKPPAWNSQETERMYQSMIAQCERLKERVAILDYPPTTAPPSIMRLREWRNKFVTRFGAIYYPWLKVPDADPEERHRRIPPCGHVAGVYARVDNQYGVQRPPGNEGFEFVDDVTEDITSLQQEQLNPYGINIIRSFPGRGIRIWGVRSLAQAENDVAWQFIHVRRVMSMIEESIDDSMQWTVFEPNDATLRKTVVHSLSVFLEEIWQRGGLKGNVPAEGFYVKCDDTNNSQSVIDAGQLVCEVGVAVAAPMEFLVFEVRQSPSGAAIAEL